MKETVATWSRRTGGTYDPPATLRQIARPLGAREACPTLFRQPGPRALADFLRKGLRRLAARDMPWVWLADTPRRTSRAAASFGAIAVLRPLGLGPCRAQGPAGRYLAPNVSLARDEPLVWVPPGAVARDIGWDRIATPEQAVAKLGPGYEEARTAVLGTLAAYIEELSAMEAAGAEAPFGPWCGVPRAERRRLLAAHAVEGRWTR